MMDNDLIAALRDAGHEDQANQLRDRQLAGQLREAGRDDLAAALEGGAAPAEAKPAKPRTQQQAHGEAIIHALKRDTGFTPEAA